MKKIFVKTANLYWAIIFVLLAATECQKNIETPVTNSTYANSQSNAANERMPKSNFQQVNIVSDDVAFNPVSVDPGLVNAWGLAFDPSGPALVNTNRFGECHVYNVATGAWVILPIDLYPLTAPTGVVLLVGGNVPIGNNDFILPDGLPASGIFVGENGLSGSNQEGAFSLIGYSPATVYTGVTIAYDGAPFIYAASFSAKRIDVYDSHWQPVNNKPFKDPFIPADYAPYNVQNINNNLFVMYAKTVTGSIDVQKGPGLGFVDIFRPDGTLLTRFAKGRVLNAPWGCAMAPASWANMLWNGDSVNNDNITKNHFNTVQSVILIGNSGDGHINAFNQDGQFLGSLRSGKKTEITIDGLKALSFAPASVTTINPNKLFFTAGPDNGNHGLFGYLQGQ